VWLCGCVAVGAVSKRGHDRASGFLKQARLHASFLSCDTHTHIHTHTRDASTNYNRISDAWRENRGEVEAQGERVVQSFQRALTGGDDAGGLLTGRGVCVCVCVCVRIDGMDESTCHVLLCQAYSIEG
jgi:hypothetical protein